jgi:hypothetical protein
MTSTLSGDAWMPSSFSLKQSAVDGIHRNCQGCNELSKALAEQGEGVIRMNFILELKHVYRQIKQMDSPAYGKWILSVGLA